MCSMTERGHAFQRGKRPEEELGQTTTTTRRRSILHNEYRSHSLGENLGGGEGGKKERKPEIFIIIKNNICLSRIIAS